MMAHSLFLQGINTALKHVLSVSIPFISPKAMAPAPPVIALVVPEGLLAYTQAKACPAAVSTAAASQELVPKSLSLANLQGKQEDD